MEEERNNIGEFGFVIVTKQNALGNMNYETRIINKKVPRELIIIQMRAFLKQLEDEYFDKFNETATFFRED